MEHNEPARYVVGVILYSLVLVWTVRARGLPELALRVEGVSKYWAGEAEAEVGVRSTGAPAPSRGWVPASLSHRPVNPEDA